MSTPAPYVPNLRARIRSGDFLVGTWISFVDPTVTEALAGAGFDFLCPDGEHGPIGTPELLAIAVAARATQTPVLYRVGANEPARIMQALDGGAAGVVVPQIRTVADAERAAAWCRYPPAGLRGVAPRRLSDYGRSGHAYLARANDGVVCCLQVETREALDALDAILAVDGVDALLIGPNDFAASLGHFDDLDHPAVEAAIAKVLARATGAGMPVGIWTPDIEVALARRAQGFRFVTVGSDAGFLVAGADAAVRALGAPG
jgi:4-hydroxy-2-oxoheptanedioate aldolase